MDRLFDFFEVYLKQEIKCAKAFCLGQLAEEWRDKSGFLFILNTVNMLQLYYFFYNRTTMLKSYYIRLFFS